MSNKFKIFFAEDNTTTYISSPISQDSLGNRTCVFQAKINNGDTVVLQARIGEEMDYVDVLTASDSSVLQEVVTASEFRVNVTNTSGFPVICAMSI